MDQLDIPIPNTHIPPICRLSPTPPIRTSAPHTWTPSHFSELSAYCRKCKTEITGSILDHSNNCNGTPTLPRVNHTDSVIRVHSAGWIGNEKHNVSDPFHLSPSNFRSLSLSGIPNLSPDRHSITTEYLPCRHCGKDMPTGRLQRHEGVCRLHRSIKEIPTKLTSPTTKPAMVNTTDSLPPQDPGDVSVIDTSTPDINQLQQGNCEPIELVTCRHCRRSFLADRIEYHESVCLQQEDRKKWDKSGARALKHKSRVSSGQIHNKYEGYSTDTADDTPNQKPRKKNKKPSSRGNSVWSSIDGVPSLPSTLRSNILSTSSMKDESDSDDQVRKSEEKISHTEDDQTHSDISAPPETKRKQSARNRLKKINNRRKVNSNSEHESEENPGVPVDPTAIEDISAADIPAPTSMRSIRASLSEEEVRNIHIEEYINNRKQAELNRQRLLEDVSQLNQITSQHTTPEKVKKRKGRKKVVSIRPITPADNKTEDVKTDTNEIMIKDNLTSPIQCERREEETKINTDTEVVGNVDNNIQTDIIERRNSDAEKIMADFEEVQLQLTRTPTPTPSITHLPPNQGIYMSSTENPPADDSPGFPNTRKDPRNIFGTKIRQNYKSVQPISYRRNPFHYYSNTHQHTDASSSDVAFNKNKKKNRKHPSVWKKEPKISLLSNDKSSNINESVPAHNSDISQQPQGNGHSASTGAAIAIYSKSRNRLGNTPHISKPNTNVVRKITRNK